MNQLFSPHDLLRIDSSCLAQSVVTDDAGDSFAIHQYLDQTPFAVVRRAPFHNGQIPIGVRGHTRSQRYAAWLTPHAVSEVITPMSLLASDSTRSEPAFAALRTLRQQWRSLVFSWGPTGSVGFELASGVATVIPTSDLDILLSAPHAISRVEAQTLYATTVDLGCRVDIQIETPHGAFALQEFVDNSATLLLRTLCGPVLVRDPWHQPQHEAMLV